MKQFRYLVALVLGIVLSTSGHANANFDQALTYATVNSAVATTSAIALQKAGYPTQTVNTPYGLVTTIKDSNTPAATANQPSAWQQQQQVQSQREAFMNS